MRHSQGWRIRALWLALCLAGPPAAAINIHIDYTYDTSHFFGSGNPQGVLGGIQATAAMEAAASFYSAILTDTFAAIAVPPPLHSSAPGGTGVVSWSWQANLKNPSDINQNTVFLTNPTVNANQYTVYVGAHSWPTGTIAEGGTGGKSLSTKSFSGNNDLTPSDWIRVATITSDFDHTIATRGQSGGFVDWGGEISFDNDQSTLWSFNHLALPPPNFTDFYSVALHELAHTLGFGVADEWRALIAGSSFTGANSKALNGGNPVPLSPDKAHWVAGKTSVVYGTTIAQETLMDPDLDLNPVRGVRKVLTELDAAGLKDIGWTLAGVPGVNGDYNNNRFVDAADYVVWRKNLGRSVTLPNDTTPGTVTTADFTLWRANFGQAAAGSGSGSIVEPSPVPEPTTVLTIVLSCAGTCFVRRKRLR